MTLTPTSHKTTHAQYKPTHPRKRESALQLNYTLRTGAKHNTHEYKAGLRAVAGAAAASMERGGGGASSASRFAAKAGCLSFIQSLTSKPYHPMVNQAFPPYAGPSPLTLR